MSADTFDTLWDDEYSQLIQLGRSSPLNISLQKPNISYILNPKVINKFRLTPIEWDYFVLDDTLYVVTAVSYMNWPSVTARRVDYNSSKHWEESTFSIDAIKGKTISVSEAYDMIIGQLWMALRANNILTWDDPMGFPLSKSYYNPKARKSEWMWVDDNGWRVDPLYIDTSGMNDKMSRYILEIPLKKDFIEIGFDHRLPTRKYLRGN